EYIACAVIRILYEQKHLRYTFGRYFSTAR
ncbi:unnamed protein product, partial [marine sediment metagenome]